MQVTIDARLTEMYPSLCVGVVVARGVDNRPGDAATAGLLAAQAEKARLALGAGQLGQHPRIIPWREAYAAFGAKPSKYNCSVEALLRRVQKGGSLPSINRLVDLYNYISLKYIIPAGGDDLAKVDGDIALTFASGDERFVALGAAEPESPKPGEVVYADASDILCRRWNWRECDKTKLAADTQEAAIYLEGLAPATRAEIAAAAGELAELISCHCGGRCVVHLLDSGRRSCAV